MANKVLSLLWLCTAALHANIAEERILPVHLDLEAPNKFMRAIVVCWKNC